MAVQPKKTSGEKPKTQSTKTQSAKAQKPQAVRYKELPKSVMNSLYQVYTFLNKDTRQKLGLMIKIPIFIKDPLVALENPALGFQEITVRLEEGFDSGPTSSRVVVVDYNGDTGQLIEPVVWDKQKKWFRNPSSDPDDWLPEPPAVISDERFAKLSESSQAARKKKYQEFIDKSVGNLHFHQLNAWAVVQRVLEFYEDPQAMGRPIPWGFDGNRLIVVPHAGYKENAFYDHNSKSLQLYYFGDQLKPGYTCLSHDIIAHETGHAILDGIRPLYVQPTSIQTTAFHEFMGDLTAILLALFNNDLRHFIAEKTRGDMTQADALANLAKQFSEEVQGRAYLRTAHNDQTMDKVKELVSPHLVSQVLTGAMFDILIGITKKHMDKNLPIQSVNDSEGVSNEAVEGAEDTSPNETSDEGEESDSQQAPTGKVTPKQAFWWAADRLRRVALQPLDLCPPCDIQFLDYAQAVLRNDILTNPVDENGYREILLDVFHERGLCGCDYPTSKKVTEDCQFYVVLSNFLYKPILGMVFHDIERVSRSRTAAYYFLSDNRKTLRIPFNRDLTIVDLYDTNKFGAAAERLPREIVVEYIWEEPIILKDETGARTFGRLNGKTTSLLCGGTLVFDDRGNMLSWFRKPGTEQVDPETEKLLMERVIAWQEDPKVAKIKKVKKPTKWELAELEDLKVGRQRRDALLDHLSQMAALGFIGEPQPGITLLDGMSPLVIKDDGGTVRLEQTAHLRDMDNEAEALGWKHNF